MADVREPQQSTTPEAAGGPGSPPRAGAAGLDLGRAFNDGLDLYRRNFVVLFLAAAISDALMLFSFTFLAGPFIGGWVLMLARAWERPDRKVDFGDLFRAFDRFWPLVGLFYASILGVSLGLICLIVPGIFMMVAWTFAFPLMIESGPGVWRSLSTSHRIVLRKDFWMVLWLNLVTLILLVGLHAFAPLGVILGWLALPLAYGAWYSAYVQLVREDERVMDDIRAE